jgi:uncharacterized protein YndB with AHSA1/START domain
MTVTNVEKDPSALSLLIRSEFDASIDAVWDLWNDPRKLEKWWGPPTWPATFVKHDLAPGVELHYFMTGPEGDKEHGWWRVISVDAPHSLEFDNGLADENGKPLVDKPAMIIRLSLTEEPQGHTVMDVESVFPSEEAMEMFLGMGMAEGMAGAMNQIDALL